jgi:outer membrane receptor protein involved in Fe transport
MRSTKCGNHGWRRLGVTSLLLVAALSSARTAEAQELGRITGRTSDAATQAPLSDVQVYIVGQNMGSLSRQNGAYVILNVPPGSYELRAERIGLTPLTRQITVAAGQQVEVNFELALQALGLDEIVVTGTAGAATRREVGNSITQINTVDLPDRPTSVTDMLTAIAPSMEVTTEGGGELGQGARIRIRGVNSINNNSRPIIMIDGIRIMNSTFGSPDGSENQASALDQMNPNDIERIEVISGPAASTIYGTEASGGVVQIFTRRGSQRAPVWTAETQWGTMWNQKFGANGVDYIHMDPWICTAPFTCGQYQSFANQNGFMPNGPITQLHSLSVRGGGQALQYFVSGGWENDKGATPEEALERWNVRGNFTVTPIEDLVVQWNTSYSNTSQKNSPTGNQIGGLTLSAFRGNQNYIATADTAAINSLLDREIGQLIERFTTGGTFTYSPLTNFTNRLTIGYDFSFQERKAIEPFGFIQAPQGTIGIDQNQRRFLTFDYVGTYTLGVTESLRSSLSWGGQAIGDASVRLSGDGEGFPGTEFPTLTSASTSVSSESRQKTWNSGFFFQNVFDLSQKYFLTLGLRVDGNSTFGKNFNLQMYPKASAAWVVSDESFWREQWGEMKLRAAWGKSGRAPGAFVAQRTWENRGLGGEPAFIPQNLGNPDIGPEVTSELEVGFDAAWFGDRIRPGYTYYYQNTKDAIQGLSGIPSTGFTSSVSFNVGETENWGHELRLDVTALRTRNWGLDITSSIATNGNNVVSWLGSTNPGEEDEIGRPIEYNTWTMYQNPEGMGTQRRTDGTYGIQSCYLPENENTLLDTPREEWQLRPGLDPKIHACSFPSEIIYGYPEDRPGLLLNGMTTVRFPLGISLTARGEFRGGHGWWENTNAMGSAVGRNARSPVCLPYYVNDTSNILRTDTPGIWVARCQTSGTTGYWHKAKEFALHSLSATIPMDFAFPDQVQNATLTLVMGELLRLNQSLWNNYPYGVDERVPPPTTLRASMRVTF